jgi:hypothetical protein
MFFNGRWVYFCFIVNWYAEAHTDPETVSLALAAVNKAVNLVFNTLSAQT